MEAEPEPELEPETKPEPELIKRTVRFLNTGSLFLLCLFCESISWDLPSSLFAFKCRTQTRTLKTTYKSNWKVKSSYIKVLKTMMQQPTKNEISNKWNTITIDLIERRYPCTFIIAAYVRKMAGRYAFSPCGYFLKLYRPWANIVQIMHYAYTMLMHETQ
jgi:hypothetical protein